MKNEPKPCNRCGAPRPWKHIALCADCNNRKRRAQYAALTDTDRAAINRTRAVLEQRNRVERNRHGQCTECGEPLDRDTDGYLERCCRCRDRSNAACRRRTQRIQRERPTIFHTGDQTHRRGRLQRLDGVHYLGFSLDADTFAACDTLRHRERERRQQQAEAEGITDRAELAERRSLLFLTGRLLRYVIKCYHRDHPDYLPERIVSKRYRGRSRGQFVFLADRHTLYAVYHFAKLRDGNLSRTISDILCAAAFPSPNDFQSRHTM